MLVLAASLGLVSVVAAAEVWCEPYSERAAVRQRHPLGEQAEGKRGAVNLTEWIEIADTPGQRGRILPVAWSESDSGSVALKGDRYGKEQVRS